MPCYHPLHGYKAKLVNPTGKRSIVFKLRNGLPAEPVTVPCGRCIGCRLETSRQWALRCVHEAQLHQDNAFITLTYAPENLPYGGTLIKKDFQDFMKRVRKKYAGQKISYYHCGEYGELCQQCELPKMRCRCPAFDPGIGRPHYHALLFGLRFFDQQPFTKSADGSVVYTSAELSNLWPSGFSTVGEVTFESAAYVARYVMKKITGKAAADHYEVVDPDTGEILRLQPEYTTMSLKPAIAKEWYGQFSSDVFPSDEVVHRGKRMKPPKYYDRLLEAHDLSAHTEVKAKRLRDAAQHAGDNTKQRLLDREVCKLAQIKNLKRGME